MVARGLGKTRIVAMFHAALEISGRLSLGDLQEGVNEFGGDAGQNWRRLVNRSLVQVRYADLETDKSKKALPEVTSGSTTSRWRNERHPRWDACFSVEPVEV